MKNQHFKLKHYQSELELKLSYYKIMTNVGNIISIYLYTYLIDALSNFLKDYPISRYIYTIYNFTFYY